MNETPMKRCSRCGKELPATTQYFFQDYVCPGEPVDQESYLPIGLKDTCKECTLTNELKRGIGADSEYRGRLYFNPSFDYSGSDADWKLILKSQTGKDGKLRCWFCGEIIAEINIFYDAAYKSENNVIHLDHWIPRAKHGTNNIGCLHLMHPCCNLKKGAKMPFEFGRLI